MNCSTHTSNLSAIIGGATGSGLLMTLVTTTMVIIGFVMSAKRRKDKRNNVEITL